MIAPSDTFVYNTVVVRWTGRSAVRQLKNKTETLYEIEPIDKEEGSWQKWAKEIELFVVKEASEQS